MSARPWAASPGALVLDVRLTPKGGRDAIDGVDVLADGQAVLKARVRVPPHEGAANEALVKLVAKSLDIAPRFVELVGGATSRIKRLRIVGDTAALAAALEKIAATR